MKPKQFIKSFKRFTAAVALGCLLFVGTANVQPAAPQEPETVAYVLTGNNSSGLLPGIFVPQGNYWSG
ncbi:MAG: hypothetical protein H6657_07375 [Ardenticatenaceae bacterium]|nr:hypothetical protein [Ardenticatenaceae bacterium]